MKYEFRGKTVKDAILKGLKKLGLENSDDVSITILDEGSRGLFETSEGLRPAVVMMEPKSQKDITTKKAKLPTAISSSLENESIITKGKTAPDKKSGSGENDKNHFAETQQKTKSQKDGRRNNNTIMEKTDRQEEVTKAQETAKKFLRTLLNKMNVDFSAINSTLITGRIFVNVISKKTHNKKEGAQEEEKSSANNKNNKKNFIPDEDTIFSIETILNEIIRKNKKNPDDSLPAIKLHLDFDFAIRRREEEIRLEAIKIAQEVVRTGKTQCYREPLCFHFRKVVHDAVREVKGASSVSKLYKDNSESYYCEESGWGEKKIVEIYKKES